jgi:CRP/FNR family cyclic AMP-dependent transcriptional regulator
MLGKPELLGDLRAVPWLMELTSQSLEQLARIAFIRTLDSGEILFREGEREDNLYIIMEGELALESYVPSRGNLHIFTAGALDVLGWSSLTPIVRQRVATATTCSRVRLLGFNSKELEAYCQTDHSAGYIIMRRLANVVATHLLTTRLQLYDLIVKLEISQVE